VVAPEYSIHEFAALAGLTVKTLHHYDRVGLLQPRRTAARYRVYTADDLTRLRQILALRSLGLPLRRVRELLAPGAPPLRLTLQQQRHVLQDRQRHIDRAIRALEAAEAALEASPDGAGALQTLIEAIGMQDSVDEMRRYYSDEAWDVWRHHYEEWPPAAWRALYRDVNALLDETPAPDPMGAAAQALGARWLALDTGETRISAVRTGLRRAWMDRQQWPAWMQARLAEHRVDRATRFINTVLWERWEAERLALERSGNPAPARVSDARIALYRDCAGVVAEAPGGDTAQALVRRWTAILEAECGGDAATIGEQIEAWRSRRQWAPAMVRYMASCYGMDADTWQRAADLLEAAYDHGRA
jgi:MerR family transcriptional regulator, thiopeptide resistance regulator